MSIWSPPLIPARIPGWERGYAQVLALHTAQPFAWGVSDCLMLPVDLCLVMTGVDVFPMALRTYSDAEGASRVLLELGLSGVQDALEKTFKPIPRARARRGDCGVRELTIGGVPVVSTFIVIGNGMAVGKAAGRNKVVVPVLDLGATFAIGEPG